MRVVHGAVSVLDATIARDNTLAVGNKLRNAPGRSARLWGDYGFAGAWQPLTVSLGTTYVGERFAALRNSYRVPSPVVWDAGARYAIGKPLGMDSTAITLNADMKKRLATGYGMPGVPAQTWDMPALAGMDALRSSSADMLQFVGAHAGIIASPLYPARQAAHKPQQPSTSGRANRSPWAGISWTSTARTSCGTTAAPPATARTSAAIRTRGAAWSRCPIRTAARTISPGAPSTAPFR
ncbi:TonB-dependent receptor [Massilia sp. DJPM01]|nr:TonB-dependent receptor [Massilia sp. DJPM01]MDM5177868.1 TonB-dependent receptor [Massilia sp. DJPM01]